jgi:hypothetical protein
MNLHSRGGRLKLVRRVPSCVTEAQAARPDIVTQLDLEMAGPDLYRFPSGPPGSGDGLFGGQVLALALRAAGLTVPPDRLAHSLHAYFLRRGSAAKSMVLKVERDTDGRSFSARRVTVSQDSVPIFTMAASFHVQEEGPDEQVPQLPGDVPDPESLAGSGPGPGHHAGHGLVEIRNVRSPEHGTPRQAWARASGPIGEDPLLHACALATSPTSIPASPRWPRTMTAVDPASITPCGFTGRSDSTTGSSCRSTWCRRAGDGAYTKAPSGIGLGPSAPHWLRRCSTAPAAQRGSVHLGWLPETTPGPEDYGSGHSR